MRLIDYIEDKLDLGCALQFMGNRHVKLSLRIANLITKDWLRSAMFHTIKPSLDHIKTYTDTPVTERDKYLNKQAIRALREIEYLFGKE